MNNYTAVVLGASGLIGNLLVKELLDDAAFVKVRVLVRKPLDLKHPKLEQRLVDFNNMDDYTNCLGKGDMIFSCVGTTIKKVKNDKMAYEKIDFEIPVNAAKIGIAKGFQSFFLVSSIGADEKSSNFYLQLKGKTERALEQFPFKSIGIFRPSILIGERKEFRFGEKAALFFMEVFSFLLFGMLRKYHPIDAEKIAQAMIVQSKKEEPGIYYFDYTQMIDLIRD